MNNYFSNQESSTMDTLNTQTSANDLIGTPFPLIADEILAKRSDPETTKQLADLIKKHGADSEIIRPLVAYKASMDDEARDELKRILDESGRQKLPLQPLDKDHASMLAARFGITNREVGDWRRRRIAEMAAGGLVTDDDIEREAHIKGSALDTMTAKLVKDGSLIRDGQGYRAPETATATA
jgi:hypothetical protein